MADYSNIWPNQLMDWLWLVTFVVFLIGKYPKEKSGDKK